MLFLFYDLERNVRLDMLEFSRSTYSQLSIRGRFYAYSGKFGTRTIECHKI